MDVHALVSLVGKATRGRRVNGHAGGLQWLIGLALEALSDRRG